MAPLTDAAFAPIGHDQITASFSSNGFSVSVSPPRPQELGGRGIGDISSTAFILCHKAAFYYHWHGDEGADR